METRRLYRVMNERLADNAYLAGDEYSIADIASWPWVSRFEWQGIPMHEFEHVRRWYLELAERPAVIAGYDVPKKVGDVPKP